MIVGKYEAEGGEYTPTISPRARTAIYVVSLAVNVIAGIALVTVLALDAVTPGVAAAIFGGIQWGLSAVSNALAVGYRPTRPS